MNGGNLTKVEELRVRILEVLNAEGKSLIADSTPPCLPPTRAIAWEHAGASIARPKPRTIWSYAVTKALAVALNPIPAVDVLGGTAVDATMVVTLGRIAPA